MAFSGVAVYDTMFTEVREDIAQMVTDISPTATPFLDIVGDAEEPIQSKRYDWLEESLLPDSFSNSSAIASTAAASNGIEIGANASLLRVGDVLMNISQTVNQEQVYVSSIGASAATIYVTRAYAGTSATSAAAGISLQFIGSAVEEGSSDRGQRRTVRTRPNNFVQTFREDIEISKLMENAKRVATLGEDSVFAAEATAKTKEVLKQLERAVLLGRTNGNTIGADDKPTTMAGIVNSIATNVVSHATYSNSILNNVIAAINDYTDVKENNENYMILAGTTAFRKINNVTGSQIDYGWRDRVVGKAPVGEFGSDFGPMPIMENRWLNKGTALVLRRDLIEVSNFAGNSFMLERYNSSKSAIQGYIEGTYGLRFRNEKAHGKLDGIS